jgi:FKBP-type peptidyl-prolyl cis-trans isomerase
MRLSYLLVVAGVILLSGCKEEVKLTELERFNLDSDVIDNWIGINGIADTLHHPTKIVYTINKKGSGTIKPRLSDKVVVTYEGRLLESGKIFDSNTELSIELGSTILGWQIMVQEMRDGDEFTIYLQSFYGYADKGSGDLIPPNTVIAFDIELVRIEG